MFIQGNSSIAHFHRVTRCGSFVKTLKLVTVTRHGRWSCDFKCTINTLTRNQFVLYFVSNPYWVIGVIYFYYFFIWELLFKVRYGPVTNGNWDDYNNILDQILGCLLNSWLIDTS